MLRLVTWPRGEELKMVKKFDAGAITDLFNHPDMLAQTAWNAVGDQEMFTSLLQQLRIRKQLHGATFGPHKYRFGLEN